MHPRILIVPSLLALASATGLFAVAMKSRHAAVPDLNEEPRHKVTADMVAKTDSMHAKTAKSFQTKDVNGVPVSIAGPGLKRPQFVYFVHQDCPCSYSAEPLFHALADQFKGKVDFVSVTNASVQDGKQWISEMQVEYPVVSNPSLEIMRAYGAKSSAYSALVTTDGKIYKMWPGFSRDLLLDMNREISAAISEPEKPFDTLYAPLKASTGCEF